MRSNAIEILHSHDVSRLDVARAYLELGFCPIPIPRGSKKARCKWKRYQTKQPDDRTLRRWFGNGSQSSIALVLGNVSGGLVCRDFDDMRSYDFWAKQHSDLARTLPTVETGRPGRQVYAIADASQIGEYDKAYVEFADGELRLKDCYCLAPPSVHPNGHRYRFLIPFQESQPKIDLKSAGFDVEYVATESSREAQSQRRTTETTEAIELCGVKSTNQPQPHNGSVVSDALCCTAAIERAIAESLPLGLGKRNRQVFELARALKAIPALADAEPKNLKQYVCQWHRLALSVIGTKPFEETWIDFLRAWPRVKFPKGSKPIGLALHKAKESEPPSCALEYEQPKLRILVALCRELQRGVGDGVFFLSCHTAARLFDLNPTTAWRWLFLLRSDGVLQLVKRGTQKGRRASRYRYLREL